MKVGGFYGQDYQLICHSAFKTFRQFDMFDSGTLARQTFDDFLCVGTHIVIRIFIKIIL